MSITAILHRVVVAKALTEMVNSYFFPGSGCETYKMTNNASSTISALRRVTGEYIDYMKAHGDTAVSKWTEILERIPEMPLRTVDGHTMIAPAKTWERINNVETPQLYPVWPWKFYGVTVSDSADLQIARNTYLYDPDALKFRSSTGWKQDNIWAARLGLVDEAFDLTSRSLLTVPTVSPRSSARVMTGLPTITGVAAL